MNELSDYDKEFLELYRKIFPKAQIEIDNQLLKLKDNSLCKNCSRECKFKNIDFFLFEKLLDDCPQKNWQKISRKALENDISKDILKKINEIQKYRKNFKCNCCGFCCKMAGSEFSYDELKEKAKYGDKFAKQFISVFIPYISQNEARKINPQYFDYVLSKKNENTKMYFYHCKKIKENETLCPEYKNRPDICKIFPTNTLIMLPQTCGYRKWQEETKIQSLLSHALISIVEFYIEKLDENI